MDDRLEEILQQAISTYADSEPLAGMEERVLTRIRVAEQPQRRMAGWGMACAAGAVGLAVVLLVPLRHEDVSPVVELAAEVRPAVAIAPKAVVRVVRRPRGVQVKASPKLAVFPAPTPLTNEEHRLLAWVERDPQGTAEAFQSLQKRNDPIEIAPLEIKPLEIGRGQ
jgi:hypothetical protein